MGSASVRLGVLTSYLAARHRRFADRDALLAWQQPRLQRALHRARVRFPGYSGVTSDDLAAFPLMDRGTWLDGFEGLNDRGLSLQECLAAARDAEAGRSFGTTLRGVSVGLSTGTSGRQGAFLTSPAERSRWAGTLLAKALPAGLLAGARIALVLRAGGPLYASMGSSRIRFTFIDLYAPTEQQRTELREFAPTVLAAPPVLLDQLGAARARGRLPISPAAVYSIADVLDPDVAARIQAGFGVAVGQVYQATEGFLGITCAHGTLHLNEDLLHFEREEVGGGRFTPVVTDLFRTTQAVIRYRIGDVLHPAAAPCPCGSPLQAIDHIEGRDDDVLRLARAAGGTAPCFADLIRGLVLGTARVVDFHLEQDAPRHLRLAVTPDDAWPAAAAALASGLSAAGFVEPIVGQAGFAPPDPTRKRRRVSRTWR